MSENIASGTRLRASVIEVAGQQRYRDSVFPDVLRCDTAGASLEDAKAWIGEQKVGLLERAAKHGVVLLRDFPIHDVEAFDAVVRALALEPFRYAESLSNAVRINLTDLVFTANEAPRDVQIYFHHEMAQTPLFPGWLIFYCDVPAEAGGATPICRSDVLYERLLAACPDFIQACAARGLEYSNVMPDVDDAGSGMGRSWRSTLGVQDRSAAEQRLRTLGYRWEWLGDGNLRMTTPVLPALMEIAPGRTSFFNQVIAAFRGWKDERNDPSAALRHGDGTPLDVESVGRAIAIADELAFDLAWQAGDCAIIDNRVAMHGRRPFEGTRRVVASLAEKQTQAFSAPAEV
jgi:hypothetical protein